jgi:hypothetical protein
MIKLLDKIRKMFFNILSFFLFLKKLSTAMAINIQYFISTKSLNSEDIIYKFIQLAALIAYLIGD